MTAFKREIEAKETKWLACCSHSRYIFITNRFYYT